MGKCLDISVGGLGVEVAKRIPVGTEVRVRADWVNLDGVATVRHIRERGGVFHTGLELKRPLLAGGFGEGGHVIDAKKRVEKD